MSARPIPLGELEQRRRSVRVLELMGESWRAEQNGDRDRCNRLRDEAHELDYTAVTIIIGDMQIGELPWPSDCGWGEYLDAQRQGLAEAEAAAR
jgi:hypothetical protein